MLTDFTHIKKILVDCQVIAVVGLSPKASRPSNQVATYLQEKGYTVIPVNPGQTEILGQTCYPDLLAIPAKVDLVNIFRKSEDVEPVVADAVKIQARAVWMQQGIVNQKAAEVAREAGIAVVMDRCIKVDHQNLITG
ncbi:MAG: CoA-binding protein [Desulfobulbaceae bacterium]|uniref:CoA-binding protein n=1 Tax=Candidatus Desulfobia pelagia TaxID=2841692 RepID=A0A8J6NCY2_9BACT|nr:CoA-binding protein [Candidatus Desulfobia pelagia]